MSTSNSPEDRFAKLVQESFLDRMIRQRNSSPQTVAAYRDCFRLLFEFARDQRKKPTDRIMCSSLFFSISQAEKASGGLHIINDCA